MTARLNADQQALVSGNLGLVHLVLKNLHINRDYDDYFSIGCIGLCNAALHWRPGGAPFSTYAYHLIRHALISRFQYAGRAKRSGARLESFVDTDEAFAIPDERFERLEMREALRTFVPKMDTLLGDFDAGVIRLLAMGKSVGQTAQMMQCTLSAVWRARKRAAMRLTQWLNEE